MTSGIATIRRTRGGRPLTRERQSPSFLCGYTLLEMLAGLGILAILLTIVIVASRSMIGSQARTLAQQQLQLIAAGIERYAAYWPRPEIGGVVVADRAWPDPFPIRVFSSANYQSLSPFNDHVEFRLTGLGSGIIEDTINYTLPDRVVSSDGTGGDVMAANVCLTYALLARSGSGPYLEDTDASAIIKRVSEVDGGSFLIQLPPATTGNANVPARVVVDPWGTPYRYFWVYRDSNAYRGYLPVSTANSNSAAFRKAVGFVLESAGPNRKFGDVWRIGVPPTVDLDEAADNIVISVP